MFTTEQWVDKILNMYNINNITDLSIEQISTAFNVEVFYSDFSSKIIFDKESTIIFLNKTDSSVIRREIFFNKLGSILMKRHLDIKNSSDKYLLDIGLPYFLAIPSFIFEEQNYRRDDIINYISERCSVSHDFACVGVYLFNEPLL